jgi:hypothetical protein
LASTVRGHAAFGAFSPRGEAARGRTPTSEGSGRAQARTAHLGQLALDTTALSQRAHRPQGKRGAPLLRALLERPFQVPGPAGRGRASAARLPGYVDLNPVRAVIAETPDRWQPWRGVSGRLAVGWGAALPWNQWQGWTGIRRRKRRALRRGVNENRSGLLCVDALVFSLRSVSEEHTFLTVESDDSGERA